MGKLSGISWTDHTFNPWWGCHKVSPGCAHCYADTFAARAGHAVWGLNAPRRFFGDKHWRELETWNRDAKATGIRAKVFIASMADLFELHPDPEVDAQQKAARARLFGLVDSGALDSLDLLFLTKRPENVTAMVPGSWLVGRGFPRNVWMGCTVEDNQRAGARLPHLLGLRKVAPVSVLWVSYEPALELVDFRRVVQGNDRFDVLRGAIWRDGVLDAVGQPYLDWIVVGGESGGKRRPFDPAWADTTADACRETGVACWVKQDGAFKSGEQGRISAPTWAVKQHPEVLP